MPVQTFHTDITHDGAIKIQQVATLPGAVSSSDARRIIYTADTKLFYICDGTTWAQISSFDHNDLASIQGGDVGEYYHLNNDQFLAAENSYLPSTANPFATHYDITKQYAIIEYQEPNATVGASIAANTWTKIDLNTVIENGISGLSISSGVITLPFGTYRVISMEQNIAWGSGLAGTFRLRFRRTSATAATIHIGQLNGNQFQRLNVGLSSEFVVASTPIQYEMQAYTSVGPNTLGTYDAADTSGLVERHGRIVIERIAHGY